MSFQPLPFTWYSSMPRTIAADCAARVGVRAGGVVHDREAGSRRAYCGGARRIVSSAPHAEPRDDRRRARDREPARGGRLHRAPEVVRAQPRHVPARPVADRGRRARPLRVAEAPARDAVSSASASGPVGVQRAQRPAARRACGNDGPGAAPVQADHVEARRGAARASASRAAERRAWSSTAPANAAAGAASAAAMRRGGASSASLSRCQTSLRRQGSETLPR